MSPAYDCMLMAIDHFFFLFSKIMITIVIKIKIGTRKVISNKKTKALRIFTLASFLRRALEMWQRAALAQPYSQRDRTYCRSRRATR